MRIPPERVRLGAMMMLLTAAGAFIYFTTPKILEAAPYQAAVTRSMSLNFANWFFGAVDPAATVSLDKIPGSYWIPAIFVKVFGFHTATLDFANGLATIGAVIAIALTGRRIAKHAGLTGWVSDSIGFFSGITLLATPIVTAVARSNEPESYFLLFLAIAFHRAVVAIHTGKRSQLIYAGLWIALAFQTYMIEAWVLWPAIIVAWFCIREKQTIKKIADLAIAGGISLLASLIWIVIVELTPTDSRPYIGGTLHNSAFEMVFGYNALGRLSASDKNTLYRSFTPTFAGKPGIFRLFNPQDAGQIGWLLTAAAAAIIVIVLVQKFDATLVLAGSAFVLFFLEYSFVAGMHQYYTAVIAVPVAVAFAYLLSHGKPWMLVLVGLVGAASALFIQKDYTDYFPFMPYVALGLVGLLVVASGLIPQHRGWLGAVLVAGLVVTPATWSIDTMNHPNSTNPVAGPVLRFVTPTGKVTVVRRRHPVRSAVQDVTASKEIRNYLATHEVGKPRYELATISAVPSSLITNTTGIEVIPIGGFSGFDPVPTVPRLRHLVDTRQLQYILYSSGFVGRKLTGNTGAIVKFTTTDCSAATNTLFGEIYHCNPNGKP